MKKTIGRLCLALLWILIAINALYAAQVDLLQQQAQNLTTQAINSDALLKQLLEKVDKVTEKLKALNQQPMAATSPDDTIDLTCDSKVWQQDDRIEQLQQEMSTLVNQKNDFLAKFCQKADEENELLKRKFGYASQEKLEARQARHWDFKISVNCTLASLHVKKLTRLSNGKKYFFSNPATYGNWTFADEKCKEMGLHLATIRNEVDLNAVVLEAKKKKNDFGCWWLSAKNYGNHISINFLWHDGSELEDSSALWRENANKKECVCSFIADPNKKLQGLPCTLKAFFICEHPAECSCSKKSD
ncbi:uncharacterized protein LOC132197194 [Neocloeon triangulifer]|uniref:uncharacterized protein LOC132197194 n=1 Tax=Neocloeon triangulifer TaxID=2078957 RepID=UPI00286F725E|nr:uncharacterized protein LOC132197194 [Neocloeon triangulifer]